jgi:hypothetical protein
MLTVDVPQIAIGLFENLKTGADGEYLVNFLIR